MTSRTKALPLPRCCLLCGTALFSGRSNAPSREKHGCRGLCELCRHRCRRDGTLGDYERVTRSRDELLADYSLLRQQGYGWRDIAERLGMTYAAFERAIYRARKAGDDRAAR